MPTLAVLYEDNKQKRHVKTYVINLKDKELAKGPWSQPNVESGASLLHSLPRTAPLCQQISRRFSALNFPQAPAEACSCSAIRALRTSRATQRWPQPGRTQTQTSIIQPQTSIINSEFSTHQNQKNIKI
jgi:hypothetical protein